MSELTGTDVDALRQAFTAAGYTVRGAARLGAQANGALARNETTLAGRRTGSGDALDTMIRLFLLQHAVPESLVLRAFPGLDWLLGIVAARDGEARAVLDIRPYAEDGREWWVVADLTPGLDGRREPMRSDYVLGIAPASLSLIHLTVPIKAERGPRHRHRLRDQSLHLADRVNQVVATDVNPRALQLARWTAALNRVELDVREGSLYGPRRAVRSDREQSAVCDLAWRRAADVPRPGSRRFRGGAAGATGAVPLD